MHSTTPFNARLDTPPDRRFLDKEECFALGRRVMQLAQGGETYVWINTEWHADLRWARNRTTVSTDRRNTVLRITRVLNGAAGMVSINQIDEASLHNAVQAAEREARYAMSRPPDIRDDHGTHTYPDTPIWSESTFQLPRNVGGDLAGEFMSSAEHEGMVSAGYIHTSAQGQTFIGTTGPVLYTPRTYAECSITVRDPKQSGSGWAGRSSYDWVRFDPRVIAETALDKCRRSRNPVALEPGRYVTIFEPQAAYALVMPIVNSLFRDTQEETIRPQPQDGIFAATRGVLSYQGFPVSFGVSKLGKKVLDERITIRQDPLHPDLGTWPYASAENPYRPVTWIENGVLANLDTDRWYSVTYWNEHEGFPNSRAFEMSGGNTTVEEMISTTKRGLLVSRLVQIGVQHSASMLLSGYTRDGIWLIENGKIVKPVKNFRFTDSPLFALNQVEQLGTPVPIFNPNVPAIVPPVKVRDFNFSSLADAV